MFVSKSGIILKNKCGISDMGHQDGLLYLLEQLNMEDTEENRRTIFVSVDLNLSFTDSFCTSPYTYTVNINQRILPDWFKNNEKRYLDEFKDAANQWCSLRIIVNKKIDELNSGYYIIKGGLVKRLAGDVKVILYNTVVMEITDAATIYEMYGDTTVKQIHKNAIVKKMYNDSVIKTIYNYSIIQEMHDNSIVEKMYDHSMVQEMFANTTIKSMYGNSFVEEMYDYSIIKEMYEHSVVETVYNNAYILKMFDDSTVSFLLGYVEDMFDDSKIHETISKISTYKNYNRISSELDGEVII